MRIPHGRLITKARSPYYYWHYWDHDEKKNKQISLKTSDRAEAERIATEKARRYLAEQDGYISREPDGKVTLYSVTKLFLEYKLQEVSALHFKSMCLYIDNFITPHFGDCPINKIKAPQIKQFRNWLLDRRCSGVYANKILSCLSGILKYAEVEGWIDSIPTVTRAKEIKMEHGYCFNDDQIRALLTAARTINHYALYYIGFGVFCGLRVSETLSVKWEWIDWNYGSTFPEPWKIPGIIRLPQQKNRTDMVIALGAMKHILGEVDEADRTGNIVMYSHGDTGKPRPTRDYRKTWKRIITMAGMAGIVKPDGRKLSYHDLRHTFVTRQFMLHGYDARNMSRHSSQDAFIKYLHSDRNQVLGQSAKAFEHLILKK